MGVVDSFNKTATNTEVSKTTFNFTNNIEKYVGRAANSEGRIIETDVLDFDEIYNETNIIDNQEKYNNIPEDKKPSGTKSILEKIFDFKEKAAATNTIIVTSAISGILKVFEKAGDGILWGTAAIGSALGFDTTSLREAIKIDAVGELNRKFYEETEYGKVINEKSIFKYDSKVAKTMQNITEKGTEFGLATAATVLSGGGATFAFGAVVGLGASAESNYKENGSDLKLSKEFGIAFSGAVGGLSTMAIGASGAAAYKAIGTVSEIGLNASKEVALNTLKKEGKKILKSATQRTILNVNNIGGSVASMVKSIINEEALGYSHEEANREMWMEIGAMYASSFVGNLFEDYGNRTMANLESFSKDLMKLRVLQNQTQNASKYSRQIDKLSGKWGCSQEETKAILDGKLSELISHSEVGIRIGENGLDKVLESGGFKNQFETGTTKGAYSISGRMDIEQGLFGTSKAAMDSDRPIYGMAFNPFDEDPDYYSGKSALGTHYGRGEGIVVILDKDKIADSTTFTLGDSLAYDKSQVGGLMSDPHFSGSYEGWGNMSREEFQGASLTDLFKKSGGTSAIDLVPQNSTQHYLEFQIHGQENHGVDVIKEVIFSKKTPSAEIIKKLTELGIKYKIAN